jgi:hypothetical protein
MIITSRAGTEKDCKRKGWLSPKGLAHAGKKRPGTTKVRAFGHWEIDGPRRSSMASHQALLECPPKRPVAGL